MNKFVKTDLHQAELFTKCAVMNIISDLVNGLETEITVENCISIGIICICFSDFTLEDFSINEESFELKFTNNNKTIFVKGLLFEKFTSFYV